jgi:hypothetical protein
VRLRAIVTDQHAKISAASSYIAYLGLAGAEITSSHNYDELRDAQGNPHLRTKAQLRRDEQRIHACVPPHDGSES